MKKSNLKVALYNETLTKNFEIHEIGKYVQEMIPSTLVESKKQLFKPSADLALELARIKVRNISLISSYQPLYGEIEYEKKILEYPDKASSAILYDGEGLQQIARKLIPKEKRSIDYLHIIFTERLFASFNDNDQEKI